MPVIDDYLKKVTPAQKAVLERIHSIIKETVPEAEEVISYGMPGFKYNNQYLIWIAAFKNHLGLYPASDAMVEALGEQVAKFRTSKGTLRFTVEDPIPDSLVKKIVTFRLSSIS